MSINFRFIEENINEKWDWEELSKNPSINVEFIGKKHINLPWVYTYLSSNPFINVRFIEKYIDKRWNWVECGSLMGLRNI